MNKIKAIIYDFDGVICDSVNVKTEAFGEMYAQYGKEIQKKGRPKASLFNILVHTIP